MNAQQDEHASAPGLLGFAKLAKMVFDGIDLKPVSQGLFDRIAQNPDDANAMLDASFVLQIIGQPDLALTLQRDALALQRIYHRPAASDTVALRLMALCSPGNLMANTPIENLLADADIDLTYLYITDNDPLPEQVPDHDLLFVAAAESDANRGLLEVLDYVLPHWPRPVLNRPQSILQLSRTASATLLHDIPGVVMPLAARIERAQLAALGEGTLALPSLLPESDFPIIVRPVGSHAGHGLEKLDAPAALAGYLAAAPELEFSITRFIDYSSADGQFRKYRIAVIDGQAFACHMAISSHWMVHYLNAGMTESAEKRAEEARFMDTFEQAFASRHAAALAEMTARLGLEYYGIDCAETPDGQLLIFEVDTAMIVHAMDPVDMFPYKQPAMRKVFAAFRELLLKAAKRPAGF